MITTFIENIKTIETESAIAVCESIIGMIDKHELVQEYSENEEYSDVTMESMLWFMESKNRERDKTPRNEISQWMEKKGYWYTGDNPKKKKECMRMYHFLQQHKFDPSDETYESDIDNGKGGKKRLKLSVKIDEPHGAIENEINMGYNALSQASSHTITIPHQMMKGKQLKPQTVLKHEEGHIYSYDTTGVGHDVANDRPDIRKDIDDYKLTGVSVNKHDDSVEEILADVYGIKHTKLRTKGAGKNNGQQYRTLKDSEIERFFKILSKNINRNADYYKKMSNSHKGRIKDLEYLERLKSINNEKDLIKLFSILCSPLYKSINKELYKQFHDNVAIPLVKIFVNNEKEIKDCENQVKKLTEKLNEDVNKEREKFEKLLKALQSKADKSDVTVQMLKKNMEKVVSTLKSICEDEIEELEIDMDSFIKDNNRYKNFDFRRIDNVDAVINICRKMDDKKRKDVISENEYAIMTDLLVKFKPSISPFKEYFKRRYRSAIYNYNEMKKRAAMSNDVIDSSTKMRLTLVKKYIKEYFTDMFLYQSHFYMEEDLIDDESSEYINEEENMTTDEFIRYISSKNIDDDKVDQIKEVYGADLSELVKSIISSSDENIFLDTGVRLLSYQEILSAEKELGVEFKSKGIIPLFDCNDNDFIVYHYNDDTWSKFNIVDETIFKKADNLTDLIDDESSE